MWTHINNLICDMHTITNIDTFQEVTIHILHAYIHSFQWGQSKHKQLLLLKTNTILSTIHTVITLAKRMLNPFDEFYDQHLNVTLQYQEE